MGYSENASLQAPLWERYRDCFPVTRNLVYLNHAAVAPLPLPVADAMKGFAEDACTYGALHYHQWLETYESLRVAAARLIAAGRNEIAIVKNTSEGISTIATGLDWRPGDKVVTFVEEFSANYYPWKRLEGRGVRLELLSITDPLEAIETACRGARLLAISHVNYLSGLRVDLHALGEICRRHNCLFFVDAIQGLGAFAVDVQSARIDALAADGHKWLLGPEGCGILYVRRDLQDLVEPVEFGWTNAASYADYGSRDMTLRPDAGRYECGTLNTIGCFGLRAALEFLLEIGIEPITHAVLALSKRIVEGLISKGYEVLGPACEQRRSAIVSFRKPGTDSRQLARDLFAQRIIAAPRQGWVRTSPHFYLSPDEIDRFLAALPS
jgi:selenocysteine lyase/cysteine desulfurase